MIFNTDQIAELTGVIDFFHALFIGNNVGADVLSKDDIKLLQKNGIVIDELSGTFAEDAYKFGILASALKDERTKKLNYNDFKKFINSGNFIPLTSAEQDALQAVKQHMYADIKGLGNRISQDFTRIAIEASQKQRAKYEQIIKKTATKAIQNRWSVNQMASELGHKTGDWARDFDRISDYVMHSAYQQGIASQLLKQYGEEVKVFFSVYEKACKHCVATYLTDGIGSEPKQFKLLDVIANGNNIGVKAIDYKPSVDPLHPYCRCTMHNVPENGVWDAEKKQFVIGRNTYGVKRKSKIKITIS